VALNAMSVGSLSLFVQVCLGTAIVIPISVGYFGVEGMLDLVNKVDNWGLGFRVMPFLFQQWGPFLALAASVMWFGLLFFAGITSSLAMGTPCIAFMQDEFGWRRASAAWAFGAVVALLGLPTVIYFNYGVFDEYDHWAGPVSLVVFAFFEMILFAWVFGMKKGWEEITRGADIKVPIIFRYIIQYVTPVILGWVLFANMPANWDKIMNTGLHAQIAEATDLELIEHLKKTILYQNVTRIGLLAVWAGVAALVYVAYRKRQREGRITH
jgi:SNF family Na+-dependent transporter